MQIYAKLSVFSSLFSPYNNTDFYFGMFDNQSDTIFLDNQLLPSLSEESECLFMKWRSRGGGEGGRGPPEVPTSGNRLGSESSLKFKPSVTS